MGKHSRIILLLIIDAIIILMAVTFAYAVRFDFGVIPQSIAARIPFVVTTYAILTLLFLFYFRIYRRVWKYGSVGDIISIAKAVISATVVFVLLYYTAFKVLVPGFVIPRSIFVISAMLIMFGIGFSRFLWRITNDNYTRIQPHHRRSLIIGAGDAGSMVVKELKHMNSEHYPMGLIDDDEAKRNMEMLGVPVLGNRHEILHIVEQEQIKDIIIAMPSASRRDIAEILAICKKTTCKIKIIPRVNDLINGKVSVKTMRDVRVEDLLGREPVKVDIEEIAGYVTGKSVLVTGAGGSIGSELCRQILPLQPEQIILLGHGENSIYDIQLELRRKNTGDVEIKAVIADIQDHLTLKKVFEKYRPKVVFHAAAHKHVPLMESNPLEAIKNNVLGTRNVAECAHQFEAERFVMISTDKAVNPTNMMGATKRIAEMIVQSLDKESKTQFSAVRFGNVLGSRGSVIPVFKQQIDQGGPVTVTHPEMIRYFMTIPEAVQLVIQAGAMAKGGEIFILDMGEPVKIDDLAKDLIRLSGFVPNVDIDIVYTGIRPGEKLFEELLTKEEGAVTTKNDRIFIGSPLEMKYSDLRFSLLALEQVTANSETVEPEKIKQIVHNLVPTYQYNGQVNKTAINEAIRSSLEIVASLEKKTN